MLVPFSLSRPARGEWIENLYLHGRDITVDGLAPQGASGLKNDAVSVQRDGLASRPARGEWIEKVPCSQGTIRARSRPARGEWIEKTFIRAFGDILSVSPRKGRVD